MTQRYEIAYGADRRLHINGECQCRGESRPAGDQWGAIHDDLQRDLIRIATAVWMADRFSPRQAAGRARVDRTAWQRHVSLTVEVCDCDRWNPLALPIAAALSWLTDDRWVIAFNPLTSPTEGGVQGLFKPEVGEVCLFSGGLDSAVGLHVRAGEQGTPVVPVCILRNHVDESKIFKVILPRLDSFGHKRVHTKHLLASGRLPSRPRSGQREEFSQRARGFVFLFIAAAVALSAEVTEVHVYEPGAGAFNPAMTDAQVGAFNTRATHPGTLARLEAIIGRASEREFRIEAPFVWLTKGELCKRAGGALIRIADVAFSCDSGMGHRADWQQHCGRCTSCLLRRASMYAAVGDADPTRYRATGSDLQRDWAAGAFRNLGSTLTACDTYHDLIYADSAIEEAWPYFEKRGLGRHEFEASALGLMKRYGREIEQWFECIDAGYAADKAGAV